MTSVKRFAYLCDKLLEVYGNDLYPGKGKLARLAAVMTPEGKVFIKATDEGIHVSSPNRPAEWTIYNWLRASDMVCIWNGPGADKVAVQIEKKLALDLLADIPPAL